METPVYQLTAEEQLLLTAARVRLDGHAEAEVTRLITRVTDWQHFTRKAMETHLAPVLFRSLAKLNNPKVPQEVLTVLQKSYYAVLAANTRLYAHFGELADVWGVEGIRVIPLKGIYLAEMVYGDIGLRHLSDIDLLFRPEDMDKSISTAKALGWEVKGVVHHSKQFSQDFGTAHPFKLIKGSTVVELHVHIHNRGKGYEVDIQDYWQRATPGQLSGRPIMSPNPTDLLQHICLHLFGHMSDSVLKVSSFCDVREVLEVYSETVDWAYFKESSLRYGVWHQMQQTLYLCQQHWDVSMPEHFLSELTQEQREWANERFFLYLRQGHMDEPAKLNHALNAGMERLRNTNGTTAKIRHLKDYLFPKRAYLLQRYGANGWSLLLLRILHPAFLIRKILNALFKSLSAKVLRIRV